MVGLAVADLSGVRLVLLLLDGLLLGVLLGGDRLGEGEIDIGLSGEVTSALRFLSGVCCSVGCELICCRSWRTARASFSASLSSNVVFCFVFSE